MQLKAREYKKKENVKFIRTNYFWPFRHKYGSGIGRN